MELQKKFDDLEYEYEQLKMQTKANSEQMEAKTSEEVSFEYSVLYLTVFSVLPTLGEGRNCCIISS